MGTLSGFQEFFLQPIIKDRPNNSSVILWEDTASGTECPIIFCVGINPLQLGVVSHVLDKGCRPVQPQFGQHPAVVIVRPTDSLPDADLFYKRKHRICDASG